MRTIIVCRANRRGTSLLPLPPHACCYCCCCCCHAHLQVMTTTAIVNAYIATPRRPHEMGVLEVRTALRCTAHSHSCLPACTAWVASPHLRPPAAPNRARLPLPLPTPQVWLQEFAWTEADIPRKRAERGSSLPRESFESFCIDVR